MYKQLVIGIGTGRCGTVSLSMLLNQQAGAHVTHERKPLLPWKVSEDLLRKKLHDMHKESGEIAGDVASSWLPYVRAVLHHDPHARFVCLQRDRAETVRSFINKLKGEKNHWMKHDGKRWRKDRRWDACYPKYETDDMETAIGTYWDEYYSEVDNLCIQFPENVGKWPMEQALNSRQGVIDVLSFVGIKKDLQLITTGMVENRYIKKTKSRHPLSTWLRKVIGF